MRIHSMRLGKKNSVWIAATMVAIGVFVWGPGSSINSAGSPAVGTIAVNQLTSPGVHLAQSPNDPHRVMGVQRADCKKCHPSEVAAWMKTAHHSSRELKLMNITGSTKTYIEALKIPPETILTTSICADCHATKAEVNGQLKAISGVSCESCHGASGGEGGWLNRHQSYHADMPVARQQETPEHRAERLADCKAAGMVTASDIAGMTKRCLSCHIITNEELLSAGHTSSKVFDYFARTEGGIRHNYFFDRNTNAEVPSLWLERAEGSNAADKIARRKRIKFVVSTLASLEVALRKRSETTSPTAIPQIGGFAAALNGKLAQINAFASTDETTQVATLFAPMLGTIFAPLPTDEETYSKAADKVGELTAEFIKNHDGSELGALDGIIQAIQPHYSATYQKLNPTP